MTDNDSIAWNAGLRWAQQEATKEQLILISRAWGGKPLQEDDFLDESGDTVDRLVFTACRPAHAGSDDMVAFWAEWLEVSLPSASDLCDFMSGIIGGIKVINAEEDRQARREMFEEIEADRSDDLHSWGYGELWAMQDDDGNIISTGECNIEAEHAIVFQTFEDAILGCIEHKEHWNLNCRPVRLK